MQGYNNYGQYNNYGNANGLRNGVGINTNIANNAGWGNGGYTGGYMANNYNGYNGQENMTGNNQIDNRIFVHGRFGAEAYQLPPNVNMLILWDDEVDRFYVKGYDEKGRPRILADNDFHPHIEPNEANTNIDMSNYATKDDIKSMVADAIKKTKTQNMNGYVTVDELNKALSELCVGSGGKVVRSDESNA